MSEHSPQRPSDHLMPKADRALLEGRLEVALVSDRLRDRRIVIRPLFDDALVAIVAPSYRLAAKPFSR